MWEVFHTGQMRFYHFMQSLRFCCCWCFLKNHVFGDVWKFNVAIVKGATNSLLPERSKWPQTRIKATLECNISQCESIFLLPHTKFHGFSEKLSLAESARGGITVVIRSNMLCSVLSQPKHQLSIEQAVSAHFQAVTPSIPPSAQKHNRRKRPAGSSREEERKKNHHFLLYCALFETFWLLKARQ